MYIIYFYYIKFTAKTFTEFISNFKNTIQTQQINYPQQIYFHQTEQINYPQQIYYHQTQQINYPQQVNYQQIQSNQNYNDLLQKLNNEKLKNKKLEEEIQRLKNKINELKNNNNNLMN